MKTTNAMQLKAMIKNKAKEYDIAPQLVLQNYMLERLLERLSKTSYADKFIIKGGFLLSSVVGLSSRATMDLDTTIKGFSLTKENLKNIMDEVCGIFVDDDIAFELLKIEDIREGDDYPGLRAFLAANYPPMKVPLTVDVTTGDVITPKEIEYTFCSMFDGTKFSLLAYTLETILAEKLETILSRSVANTRPRDYYDVYILYKTRFDDVNVGILKNALRATCSKRGSEYILTDFEKIVSIISKSLELKKLWNTYQKSYAYATGIAYEDTCSAVRNVMKEMKL